MKLAKSIVVSLLAISGVALACGDALPLPFPPIPVKISFAEMAKAVLNGYTTRPGYAAAMKKVDELGSAAVGQAVWHANEYMGYFTYSVNGYGANIVLVDKMCDSNAVDNVAMDTDAGGAGGAGGGSNRGGGYTGIVGFTAVVRTWSTDANGLMNYGTYIEYVPIYGIITNETA